MIIPVTENLGSCGVSSIWEPYTQCMVEFALLYHNKLLKMWVVISMPSIWKSYTQHKIKSSFKIVCFSILVWQTSLIVITSQSIVFAFSCVSHYCHA